MLDWVLRHRYMRLSTVFFITLITLIIAACAQKQVSVDYENINIQNILELARANHDEIRTLRGVARVKAKSSFDDVAINQVTLLELPLRFRLEALAVFGQSIAVLTSDGEKVIFRTSSDEITFQDVRNFNLSYFYPGIPEELKTEQLIDLLLGKVPFGLWEDEYDVSFDKDREKIVVEYANSDNKVTVLNIDPVSGNIESAKINLEDNNILYINYTNFQKSDNLVFPRNIKFNYISYELTVKYNDLTLNGKIEDSLFFQ